MKILIRYGMLICLGWLITTGIGFAQISTVSVASVRTVPEQEEIQQPVGISIEQKINEGKTAYQQRDWDGAISIWQNTLTHPSVTPIQRANLWTYVGMAHQKQGDIPATMAALDRSEQLLDDSAESTLIQARILNTRGQLALTQGNTEVALIHWQQTADIYGALGHQPGVTGSLLNQARALEIGGYYRRACQTLLIALELDINTCQFNDENALNRTNIALAKQPDPRLQLLMRISLGNVLRHIGYLTQAQQILEEGRVNSPLQVNPELLLSLGQVKQSYYQQAWYRYQQRGREQQRALDEMIELATQSLDHYRTALSATLDDSLKRNIVAHILELLIQLETDLPENALNTFQPSITQQINKSLRQVKQLPTDLPPERSLLTSQISLANSLIMLLARNNTFSIHPDSDIIPLLLQAQNQATVLNDIYTQSQALGTLGHVYEVMDHQNQAKQMTQEALALAQSVGADHLVYQWQWQLGRLTNPTDALPYYQAAVNSLDNVRQNLLTVETDVRFLLRDAVEPLYRELVTLLLNSPHPSQTNLKQAVREIDALQLARLEDFLSCNLTQQVTLDEHQLDNTAAVLYPIVLPGQLAVIVRLPDSDNFQFYRTSLAADVVNHTLDQLRLEIEQPFLSETFFQLSQQVYNWLIQPIELSLTTQSINNLVFVADGALRNIPMAALHDGQQFLIERYGVALSPSLQLPISQPLSDINLETLAFGLSTVRANFPPHQGFRPLVNVENELAKIKDQVRGENLLNQQFTRDNLQQSVANTSATVVHLATHGQFSSNPKDTFLLSWDQRIDLDQLSQILNHRTSRQAIELLILSACKTAAGDSRATLGLAGVAIQSGARSTIASLWNVNDVATSQFMGYLYEALNKAETTGRAQALRQAQIRLLNTPGYQAPIYWAAYVLVGNWY